MNIGTHLSLHTWIYTSGFTHIWNYTHLDLHIWVNTHKCLSLHTWVHTPRFQTWGFYTPGFTHTSLHTWGHMPGFTHLGSQKPEFTPLRTYTRVYTHLGFTHTWVYTHLGSHTHNRLNLHTWGQTPGFTHLGSHTRLYVHLNLLISGTTSGWPHQSCKNWPPLILWPWRRSMRCRRAGEKILTVSFS